MDGTMILWWIYIPILQEENHMAAHSHDDGITLVGVCVSELGFKASGA